MFDLFTQEALGRRPRSGVSFSPVGDARQFYQTVGGKIYRCYHVYVGADPWSTDLNMDPGKHIEGWGPSIRIGKGIKCFYVADAFVDDADKDPGPPPGHSSYGGGGGGGGHGGYGGAGYGSGYGNGHSIHPEPPGPPLGPPIPDSIRWRFQFPRDRPPSPLCEDYKARIQSPEMYKRILDLFHYTQSAEAENRIERGFTLKFDGTFEENEGVEDAVVTNIKGFGTIHTHIDLYTRTRGNLEHLYASQCFSYKDLQQFLYKVGQSISYLPWTRTRTRTYKDLRSIFYGVVTPRGLYILTADTQVDSLKCDSVIRYGNTYYGDHPYEFSDEEMANKSKTLQTRLAEKLDYGISLESCAEMEEQEMLKYIQENLTHFGYNIRMLFFDLASPELNTFDIIQGRVKQEEKVKYITDHRELCK